MSRMPRRSRSVDRPLAHWRLFPGNRAILIIGAFVNFGEIYTASVSTVMVPETKAPVGIHVLLALVLWIVSLVM